MSNEFMDEGTLKTLHIPKHTFKFKLINFVNKIDVVKKSDLIREFNPDKIIIFTNLEKKLLAQCRPSDNSKTGENPLPKDTNGKLELIISPNDTTGILYFFINDLRFKFNTGDSHRKFIPIKYNTKAPESISTNSKNLLCLKVYKYGCDPTIPELDT